MSRKSTHMPLYGRMKRLSDKKRKLDDCVAKEDQLSISADYYLKQLKRQKLLVRDKMQRILNELKENQSNLC